MLLQSQETHSVPIIQLILYLRSFNRNSLLRLRSLPRMNSCCKQREANRNSKELRCPTLPCALPGTLVWGSRVHFSPPRPRSGSAAQRRSARSRSSPWNPWSCGSAHRCRLDKQTGNTESEALTPMVYSKRTLSRPCRTRQCQQLTEDGVSNPALPTTKYQEQGALQGTKLLSNSGQAVWGISAQGGDPHPKPFKVSRAYNT